MYMNGRAWVWECVHTRIYIARGCGREWGFVYTGGFGVCLSAGVSGVCMYICVRVCVCLRMLQNLSIFLHTLVLLDT